MALKWHWADDVPAAWRQAIEIAFAPGALLPMPGSPGRRIAGRDYGLLKAPPPVRFDVFVKVFSHESLGDRVRQIAGRDDASQEFAAACRLHAMELPVPCPLALADEGGRTFYLMEHLAAAVPLSQALPAAGAPGGSPFEVIAGSVAGLVADLARHGVRHLDVSPENVLITQDAEGWTRIHLVDARHAQFNADPAEAMEHMLATLAVFLLAGGTEDGTVEALVEVAARGAGAAGPGVEIDTARVMDIARHTAPEMLRRDVLKGRRAAEDLDGFARRYASSDDAANYRDRRFARSGHQRKVDAAERRIVEDLLKTLAIAGPILDVPCGAGRFLPIFAAGGREVVGVDASPDMLTLAREAGRVAWSVAAVGDDHVQSVPSEGQETWSSHTAASDHATPVTDVIPCLCLVGDARELPFPDRRFDLAFSMRLLHRVTKPEERVAVLRELGRVSRGWVLFSFYNCRTYRGLRDRLRGRYAGETCGTIAAEVAAAGLQLERFIPVGLLARQTLVLCRTK